MLKNSAKIFSVKVVVRLLGLISTLIAARILSPEDYGVVAACMIVQDLALRMQNIGIDQNVITQRKEDPNFVSTAIKIRIAIGIFITAVVFFAAPFSAKLLGDENLTLPLQILSFTFVIQAVINPQFILQAREEYFGPSLKAALLSKLLSMVVMIAAAFYYQSYWALIIGIMCNEVIMVIASYCFAQAFKYRPFQRQSFGEILRFSSSVLLQNFVSYFNANASRITITNLFGRVYLGLISMGYSILSIYEGEVSSALQRSYVASVSNAIRNTKVDFTTIAKSVHLTLDVRHQLIMPIYLSVALLPDVFIFIFLGEQWTELEAFLLPICVSLIMISYLNSFNDLIWVMRRPDILLKFSVFSLIPTFTMIYLSYYFDSVYLLAYTGTLTFSLNIVLMSIAVSKLPGLGNFIRMIDMYYLCKMFVVYIAMTYFDFVWYIAIPLLLGFFIVSAFIELKLKVNTFLNIAYQSYLDKREPPVVI